MKSMFKALGVLLTLALVAVGCYRQPLEHPDHRAADAAAIRAASAEWSKAASAKDLEKSLSYYAEDAATLPPNAPIGMTKEARRQIWASMLNAPGFAMSWAPTKIDVARSSDLAYEVGAYEMTIADKKGKPATSKGKYVTVWAKQADGSWKATADIFNADR